MPSPTAAVLLGLGEVQPDAGTIGEVERVDFPGGAPLQHLNADGECAYVVEGGRGSVRVPCHQGVCLCAWMCAWVPPVITHHPLHWIGQAVMRKTASEPAIRRDIRVDPSLLTPVNVSSVSADDGEGGGRGDMGLALASTILVGPALP